MEMNPSPEQIEEWANDNLLPVLEKAGAEVIEAHYDALELAAPYTLVVMLVFKYRGERIELTNSDFDNIKAVEWLFRHWDTVQKIVKDFENRTDPFYSDVSHAFKSHVKTAAGRRYKTLAYKYVCDKIRQHTRLWT